MSVRKGWQGLSEVNHVVYDSSKITVEQLTDRLQAVGTYIRTLSEAVQKESDKGGGN